VEKRNRLVTAMALVIGHPLVSADAMAQTFPPDEEWAPFSCKGEVMTDGYRDEPGATAERDIVGDLSAPAGLRAIDRDFLYVRLRLDADPAPTGSLRPFGWGLQFDLDGDVTTYEVLILANGNANTVSVFENTVTTLPDDPNDPADLPPVAVYSFADIGRSVVASGSSFGGDPDYFLDLAVPWSDLEPLGLTPTAPVYVWAASSSNQNSLNADFACHDGSTGRPSLSDIASDRAVPDPSRPPPPQPSGDSRLEGGGGCAMNGGQGDGWIGLIALLALALRRRRLTRPGSDSPAFTAA
jgi:MYXO-CTERM domain-containing protein